MGLVTNNIANKLTCDNDSTSVKTLLFSGGSLDVQLGAKTLFEFLLSSFFMNVNKYMYEEFTLASLESVDLDPSNISITGGEVRCVVIIVEYPKSDSSSTVLTSADQYITWEQPIGGQVMNLGKMMMLTGATGNGWDLITSPGGLRLTNPHDSFDVNIKILLVN